jgi:hypothetical protein
VTLSIFSCFCISNQLYFNPPDKAVILSEALCRFIANRGLDGAESKDPNGAYRAHAACSFSTTQARDRISLRTHLMVTATFVQALFFPSSETLQHPLFILRDAQIQVPGDANVKPAYAAAEKVDGVTSHSKMPAVLVSAPGKDRGVSARSGFGG